MQDLFPFASSITAVSCCFRHRLLSELRFTCVISTQRYPEFCVHLTGRGHENWTDERPVVNRLSKQPSWCCCCSSAYMRAKVMSCNALVCWHQGATVSSSVANIYEELCEGIIMTDVPRRTRSCWTAIILSTIKTVKNSAIFHSTEM